MRKKATVMTPYLIALLLGAIVFLVLLVPSRLIGQQIKQVGDQVSLITEYSACKTATDIHKARLPPGQSINDSDGDGLDDKICDNCICEKGCRNKVSADDKDLDGLPDKCDANPETYESVASQKFKKDVCDKKKKTLVNLRASETNAVWQCRPDLAKENQGKTEEVTSSKSRIEGLIGRAKQPEENPLETAGKIVQAKTEYANLEKLCKEDKKCLGDYTAQIAELECNYLEKIASIAFEKTNPEPAFAYHLYNYIQQEYLLIDSCKTARDQSFKQLSKMDLPDNEICFGLNQILERTDLTLINQKSKILARSCVGLECTACGVGKF